MTNEVGARRDYRKFLKDDGRLNVRMIPRPIYVQMVQQHQRRVEVIERVFDELFWLWDLNERQRKLEAEGQTPSRADIAQEIMGEMNDSDWWKATAAFEEDLITGYQAEMDRWDDLLAPVYDLQESEGWKRRQ